MSAAMQISDREAWGGGPRRLGWSAVGWAVGMLIGLLPLTTSADDGAIKAVAPTLDRPIDFYQDVYPILEAKCLACHNVTKSEGGLSLENVEAALRGGDSGEAVEAGKPDDSLLYLLASREGDPAMPPMPNAAQAKPLTPAELGILRKWIEEGAKKGKAPTASSLNWIPAPDHIRSIQALALDPSQRYLAAGRANRVVLFDLVARKEIAQLTDPALLSVQHNDRPMYGPGVAHRDFVHAVQFSPDGNLLASSGYREVKLWERVRETRLADWTTEQPGTSLAVSPDGSFAATGHANGEIRLWNVATGQPGRVLTGHAGPVRGLAFLSKGEGLLSGGEDKTLRRWPLAEGEGVTFATAESEITAVLSNPDDSLIATGHADNRVLVWETATLKDAPKPAREFKAHTQPITALALVTGTDDVVSASRDGTVRQWNIKTAQAVREYKLENPVTALTVSPDGKRIFAGAENGTVRGWTREDGKQVVEIKGDPVLAREVQRLTDDLTVANARTALANTEKEANDKELTARKDGAKKAVETRDAAAKTRDEAAAKAKEAEMKVAAADAALKEKPDDAELKKAKEAADKAAAPLIEAAKKADDAFTLAERGVKLADNSVTRGQQAADATKAKHDAAVAAAKDVEQRLNQAKEAAAKAIAAVRSVLLSNDGMQLLTAGDAGRIDLWETVSGKAIESLPLDKPATRAAVTSNGAIVIAAENTLGVRDLTPSWKLVARLGAPADNPLDVSQSKFADRILALAFSPDGNKLLTGGGIPSRSGELLLWDVEKRELAHEFKDAHSDTVFDVAFSRDGELIVSGAADKFVKLFDAASGKFIRGYEGHTSHVMAVGIKADRSTIVSGGADNAIKLWNTDTGEQRRTITTFQKQVMGADFIGVTDTFIACSGDKTVRMFTAANGANNLTFAGFTDFVFAVVAAPDADRVIGGGEDGVIRVWNGKDAKELFKFDPPAPKTSETSVK